MLCLENNMLIDTHAHLDYDLFEVDRDEVIARALANGVGTIITIGVDVPSSERAVKLAGKYACVYAAVGIHPTDCAQTTEDDFMRIGELAQQPKVVAIGEVGLDYYHQRATAEKQRDSFIRQIDLARQLKRPIIIHNRDSHEDMVKILKSENVKACGGVMHSFSGDENYLKNVLDSGLHVSFTGVVTFKNYKHAFIVEQTPIDRLLLETDCPFMTPEPHRGQRNEPAYILNTAQKIAEIKGLRLEDLAEKTSANARQLFRLNHKNN
jgi:TatD DNase family protein